MAIVSYGTITITDTNDIEEIYMVYAGSDSDSQAPDATSYSLWVRDASLVSSAFIWQRTVIKPSGIDITADNFQTYYGEPICITGPAGSSGKDGRGIVSITTQYCNYGNGTPDEFYNGWSTNIPTYDETKPNYWTKTIIIYTSGTPLRDVTIVKDEGITSATNTAVEANSVAINASNQAAVAEGKADEANNKAEQANQTAADALEIANNSRQNFWLLNDDYEVPDSNPVITLPAGVYVTEVLADDDPSKGFVGFKNYPRNGNIITRSDGIYLRDGVNTLTSLTNTALTFYNPGTTNAQLIIGANGTLQSGNYSYTANEVFSNFGTRIDLTNGQIYSPYFRLADSSDTAHVSAGAHIRGEVEAYTGKIGSSGSNYWYIGNFIDSYEATSALIKSYGSAQIQLGNTQSWRLSTNRIHSAWTDENAIENPYYLRFPRDGQNYYWDSGLHISAGSGNDKFLYIRKSTNNSGSALLENLNANLDDQTSNVWDYRFYVDGAGNLYANNIYFKDTSGNWVLIGGAGGSYLPISGGTITGNLTVNGTLTATVSNAAKVNNDFIIQWGAQTVGESKFSYNGSSETIVTLGNAATKGIVSTLTAGTTNTNLPTAAAVVNYIDGKNYGFGTVTSVRVQAAAPLASSQSGTQTNALNTTISFQNQNANRVLAGPTSGNAATPSFRNLVANDIPNLSWNKITSDKPTTAAGFGISDAIVDINSNNEGKLVLSMSSGNSVIRTVTITATEASSAASADTINTNGSSIGNSTQPVYFDTSGYPHAINYTIQSNVPANATFGYLAGTGLTLGNTTPYPTFNHSNSVTAKTAPAQSGKTLAWGDSFTLYEESYDAQGHITGISNYNMTLPGAPTDTKNTAGSTNISSEIYLIGAISQAANPQTYSHDTARVRANGHFVGSGYEMAVDTAMGTTKALMKYNSTLDAVVFSFS